MEAAIESYRKRIFQLDEEIYQEMDLERLEALRREREAALSALDHLEVDLSRTRVRIGDVKYEKIMAD